MREGSRRDREGGTLHRSGKSEKVTPKGRERMRKALDDMTTREKENSNITLSREEYCTIKEKNIMESHRKGKSRESFE